MQASNRPPLGDGQSPKRTSNPSSVIATDAVVVRRPRLHRRLLAALEGSESVVVRGEPGQPDVFVICNGKRP